jgi:PBP1b-binding outer membrane lipoprotein LpoB
MIKISNGTGGFVGAVTSALMLAMFLSGCAKQDRVATASEVAAQAEMDAQADLPEVIVTASREDTLARR